MLEQKEQYFFLQREYTLPTGRESYEQWTRLAGQVVETIYFYKSGYCTRHTEASSSATSGLGVATPFAEHRPMYKAEWLEAVKRQEAIVAEAAMITVVSDQDKVKKSLSGPVVAGFTSKKPQKV